MPEIKEQNRGGWMTVAEFRDLQKRMQGADTREGIFFLAAFVAGVFGAALWLAGEIVLWGGVLLAVCGIFVLGGFDQVRRRRKREIPRRVCCPACGKNLTQHTLTVVASRRCGYCGERVLAD